jgi:hypothetical protein
MSSSQSAELVQWFDITESAGLEIPASIRNMAILLDGRAQLDASGASAATLSIMAAILEAEDEDAIFAAANAGTTSSKNFIGVPFALNGEPEYSIEYKKSGAMIREQGGFPFYALIKMVNLVTGAEDTMTMGGQSAVPTLYRLNERGFLRDGYPFILENKQTGSGFNVVLLKKFMEPKVRANGAKGTA